MGEVLPDVNVLGELQSTNDVVSPLMHAVLSSYTGVGDWWVKPSWSRSLQRYSTSLPAVNAELYSASAVDRAVIFCILESHMIGAWL